MKINLKQTVSGRINLKIIKANGDIRFESSFNNLILNEGFNYVMGSATTPTTLAGYCYVGTNGTAPLETDTFSTMESVGTRIGASTSEHEPDSINGYYWYKREHRFTPSQNIDGYALSEIMFSNYDVAWSRTLIKNNDGQPTTITLNSDEYLYIIYELRLYWPTGDNTGTITIAGVADDFDYTLRPYLKDNINYFTPSHSGPIRAINVSSSATQELVAETDESVSYGDYLSAPNSQSIYTQDSYYRESTFIFIPTKANVDGGIRVILFAHSYPYYNYQVKFIKQGTPDATFGTNIPKDATKTLSLTIGAYIARRQPEYAYGSVEDGATTSLILKFDNEVLPASPTIVAFTVDINSGTDNVVTNVTTSGTTLTITVTDAIVNGDTITFSYVKATGNLVGSDDAEVENITDEIVTNNVT